MNRAERRSPWTTSLAGTPRSGHRRPSGHGRPVGVACPSRCDPSILARPDLGLLPPLSRRACRKPAPGGDGRAASSNGQHAQPGGQGERRAPRRNLPRPLVPGKVLRPAPFSEPPVSGAAMLVRRNHRYGHYPNPRVAARRPPAPTPQPPAANTD